MAPRMTRQAEFARTLGGEPALLDAAALRELNRPEGVEAYFGDMPTQVRLTLTLTLIAHTQANPNTKWHRV